VFSGAGVAGQGHAWRDAKRSIRPALILMGDWCAAAQPANQNQARAMRICNGLHQDSGGA